MLGSSSTRHHSPSRASTVMRRSVGQASGSTPERRSRKRALLPVVRTRSEIVPSPSNLGAHFAKGQALRAQGRCEEALSEYEAVLALNRNAANALINIGRCRMLTGLLDEAIAPMEQAIRLSPRDPVISSWYSSIGQVHLLQSHVELAILWFEKSRSANPGRPMVHAWLASAYALEGESERAAAELAEARKLSTDDRYSSIARLRVIEYLGVPKIRALFEAIFLVGLRKAGMSDE
jgi:tetratricopeptide (TPR) repeat protein